VEFATSLLFGVLKSPSAILLLIFPSFIDKQPKLPPTFSQILEFHVSELIKRTRHFTLTFSAAVGGTVIHGNNP
jgi:hypothetical protein